MMTAENHRHSVLKQKNKRHNTLGPRTKGQVDNVFKGKVGVVALSKKNKTILSRERKRNQADQIRKNKREAIIQEKRKLGSRDAPPFLVTVVPLSKAVNPRKIINLLSAYEPETCVVTTSQQGTLHLSSSHLKQRFSFVVPPVTDLISILDCAKISDTMLFVWDSDEESISDSSNLLLSSLKSQGMPTSIHTVMGLEELSQKTFDADDLNKCLTQCLTISKLNNGNKKQRKLKTLLKEVSSFFPGTTKIHSWENNQTVMMLLRQIGSQKQKGIFYRDNRAHMLSEKVQFEENIGTAACGTVKFYGYLRGQAMSANGLVHIPGWGDYQIAKIESCSDPHPLKVGKRITNAMYEEEIKTLEVPTLDEQESLESLNQEEVADLPQISSTGGEKVEELSQEALVAPKHITKQVPKGTSSYQAAWLFAAESEDEYDCSDDEGSDMDESELFIKPTETAASEAGDLEDDEEYETMSIATENNEDYDTKVDYKSDNDIMDRMKAVQDDMAFPDEVDVEVDEKARLRFGKYCGLESFRTSPWDVTDRIPDDYAKIFQFKNYDHARRRMFKEHQTVGVQPGTYIIVSIANVPQHLYQEHVTSHAPLALFGNLPLEQKMSVMNVVLRSSTVGHYASIKSKERLIFHVGYRRFANCPIFSEHSTGNKHKYVRYFHPGDTVVASFYAPIMFAPCPVSVFKERPDGSHDLVATGSVHDMNSDRVICKRAILTGAPFKVNRKSAVIRFMFFNREDIDWFKSIKLSTRYGRAGHIKEPLGTHGHMKCLFNGQLRSEDTIMLKLYKRMFPKWHLDPHVSRTTSLFDYRKIETEESDLEDEQTDDQEPQRKKVRFVN